MAIASNWREVTDADLDWISPFLESHVQSSMFLLDNLQKYGLRSAEPYGMMIWALPGQRGVFAITNSGSVMMQAPDATEAEWREAGALIEGRSLFGILAEAGQARTFYQVNELAHLETIKNVDEPGFRLELSELKLTPREGDELKPFEHVPMELLIDWGASYNEELVGISRKEAEDLTRLNTGIYLERDSHRILYQHGKPVSRTGFNAEVGGTVQIGGVYTPKALRGRGHARQAVALHLAEARARGIQTAVLFAATESAATAYKAIGFKRNGAYSLIVFKKDDQDRNVVREPCT